MTDLDLLTIVVIAVVTMLLVAPAVGISIWIGIKDSIE